VDIAVQYPASAVFLDETFIRSQLAGVGGIIQGQALYTDPATGTALPTVAATAGKFAFRGIAVGRAGFGQGLDVVERGFVAGFDLSALAYDAPVYLSDTPGVLSSTPGTNSAVVGRVVAMTDRDITTGKPSKILFVRPTAV